MRYKKAFKRKTLIDDLLIVDEILEKWVLKFGEKNRKRKYFSKNDKHKLTRLMDIWMWVKELKVIEDETLLKTRVEDTAYLFKSEDEE